MSDDVDLDPYASSPRQRLRDRGTASDVDGTTRMPPLPARGTRADEMDDSARRRTILAGATAGMRAARLSPEMTGDDVAPDAYELEDDEWMSSRSVRARVAARPLPPARRITDRGDDEWDDQEAWSQSARVREPAPAMIAYQPSIAVRMRVHTRAIAESARKPWNGLRLMLALCAVAFALVTSFTTYREASQPLMDSWNASAGAHDARLITTLVKPETQGTRPDLYDSVAQFNDWWNAACSAAVMSEVLTAWGAPHATIGKLIDVMQPDISLNGGLLRQQGFQRGAAAFNYRADISWHLTYNQMRYLTNTLGLPVIVNVRISYGYYHFFSGGHFLVMTGGDSQGLSIVDSSEYYIKYLPIGTFNSMFTGMTVVIVPKDFTYTLPPA